MREAKAFSELFLEHSFDPILLVEIPADGFADALLEFVRGGPAEFTLDLGGVDGITAVVAGAVFDVGDELARIATHLGRKFVNRVANQLDDVNIGPFVMAANVVSFPQLTPVEHGPERLGMVADVEPVAHS